MNNILSQQELVSVSINGSTPGFFEFLNKFDDFEGLTAYQRSIYLRILRRGWKSECYESLQNIARGCGCSLAQVKRSIAGLLKFRIIHRRKRLGSSDIFTLVEPKFWLSPTSIPSSTRATPQLHQSYPPAPPELPPSSTRATNISLLSIPPKKTQQQQEPDVVVESFSFSEYQEAAVDSLASLPDQEEPPRENSDPPDSREASASITSKLSSDDTEELKALFSEIESVGVVLNPEVRQQVRANLADVPAAIANIKQRQQAGEVFRNLTGAFRHALKNQLQSDKPKTSFAEWFSLARDLAVVSRHQERDGVLMVADMAGYWYPFTEFSSRWTLDYLRKRSQR